MDKDRFRNLCVQEIFNLFAMNQARTPQLPTTSKLILPSDFVKRDYITQTEIQDALRSLAHQHSWPRNNNKYTRDVVNELVGMGILQPEHVEENGKADVGYTLTEYPVTQDGLTPYADDKMAHGMLFLIWNTEMLWKRHGESRGCGPGMLLANLTRFYNEHMLTEKPHSNTVQSKLESMLEHRIVRAVPDTESPEYAIDWKPYVENTIGDLVAPFFGATTAQFIPAAQPQEDPEQVVDRATKRPKIITTITPEEIARYGTPEY